jgi:hypothetical protein
VVPSSTPSTTSIWKALWKLKVPRAVTMFLWKACKNILLTKENLLKRVISLDSLCPICSRESKSVGHVLWSCLASKDV